MPNFFGVLKNLGLVLLVAALSGCSLEKSSVLSPGGPTGVAERDMLFFVGKIMLLVLIPVYVMTIWFAFRYRRSVKGKDNTAPYTPNWGFSGPLEAMVWGGPIIIIMIFAWQVWTRTHELDPYKPLAGSEPPIQIQAVALNWKWVFIYPKENIATVNEVAFPVGAPVTFRITSDTVMNAFMIQGLAGQIFAMAGMESRQNMRADRADVYLGRNMQFSGRGFSGQSFAAKAMSPADYKQWLAKVRASTSKLDATSYAGLAKPSKTYPVTYFASTEADLFKSIMTKYAPYPGATTTMMRDSDESAETAAGAKPAPAQHH